MALGHVGLNHLTWERSVTVAGRDILPELLRDRLGDLADDVRCARRRCSRSSASCRRTTCGTSTPTIEVLAEQLGEPSRAEAVRAIENELLALYADPSVDEKPEALERRGGAFYSEAAVELLAAIRGAKGPARVVNLRNDGVLPFLPDDHVIEVPASYVDGAFVAEPVEALDDDIRGLVSAVAGYERLALDAAVHGGRERVVRAMRAHPLVLQHDRAERLTDLLLHENRAFLEWAQ